MTIMDLYQNEVRAKLEKEFKLKNPMQCPKLVKVVLNVGAGEAVTNTKDYSINVEANYYPCASIDFRLQNKSWYANRRQSYS